MHRVTHWIGLWIDGQHFCSDCQRNAPGCNDYRGRWVWLDYSPMICGLYQSTWTSGEPNSNQNCGVIERNTWWDRPCYTAYKFICKKGNSIQSSVINIFNEAVSFFKINEACFGLTKPW